MSTKAMGRLYTGRSSPSVGGGGQNSLGPFGSITGGDFEPDPTGGDDFYNPYQGSGGLFGGRARYLATILNAQRQSQLTNIGADKDLSKLVADLEQKRMSHEADLKEIAAKSD